MAIRTKRSSSVRRADSRRKHKVQEFSNKKIQGFKDVVTILQKAVDSYRDSCTERSNGFIWADISIGPRTGTGTVHYTLSPKLLRTIGVRWVSVGPSARRVPPDYRPDKPPSSPYVGRRLLEDAGVDISRDLSLPTARRPKGIHKHRR